jgi:hypothetical protein
MARFKSRKRRRIMRRRRMVKKGVVRRIHRINKLTRGGFRL